MKGNQRAIGNTGGDQSNLVQFSPEIQKLKNAKIKRAKELYKEGYKKTDILKIINKNLIEDSKNNIIPKSNITRKLSLGFSVKFNG